MAPTLLRLRFELVTGASRRYIYSKLPTNAAVVVGLTKTEGKEADAEGLKQELEHFERIRPALIALERVGYLIKRDYLGDRNEFVEAYWQQIWLCWRKSESLINLVAELRGYRILTSRCFCTLAKSALSCWDLHARIRASCVLQILI